MARGEQEDVCKVTGWEGVELLREGERDSGAKLWKEDDSSVSVCGREGGSMSREGRWQVEDWRGSRVLWPVLWFVAVIDKPRITRTKKYRAIMAARLSNKALA